MLTQEQREIVKKARDLIADPVHWCQGAYARTGRGWAVDIDSTYAVRFCALGALKLESMLAGHGRAGFRLEELADLVSTGSSLAEINDGPDGRQRALALFDKALAE